ncbi:MULTISPECIES: helix-turn-helix domain-containing protein [Halomonadaceae]|uniref:helix-turn-helix domain-containing protein n=1 Tax=Halomonadaceae TaxID=28256 RepID=UPI00022D2A22|nr:MULTISPECIES: helix-turn-helix transcriptional regulator [unclassified Halomonas]EHA13723.1 transcriptional regulator [Halomonas sp. HAL1]WKV93624.1 helix-turn-helix transcriptional regulator [Halomonas sp. HAL1]
MINEESTGNVYDDIHSNDADEMLIKAQLATKIGEVIKQRRLTHVKVSELTGLSQPKVSALLKGQFRGISEFKMLESLARLGRDVRIVVGPARPRSKPGHVQLEVS